MYVNFKVAKFDQLKEASLAYISYYKSALPC